MKKDFCKRHPVLAFTPVELVVLITVIVSLFSLVIPLVYHSRQQAKINLCAANLRQLGVWMHQYCKTSNGYLPAYEDGWVNRLAAMGNINVDQSAEPTGEFSCPSQPFKSFKNDVEAHDYWRGTNYGLNQHIASKLRSEFDEPLLLWTQANIKDFVDPSAKVLLADASGSNFFKIDGRDPSIAGISVDGASFADSLPPDPAIPFPFLRHANGAANFLFVDGHVDLKRSWPMFMKGPGTSGFYFWSGEHTHNDNK